MKEMNIIERLNMQFYRCHKLFKRNYFEQHMEHIKAVPFRGQGRILRLLYNKGEMSQKDIVIEMDIRPSTVWELVSKLEKAGFVEKIPNPDDKRGSIIKLTEGGRREAISAKWDLGNISHELYSALSTDEQYQLSELLNKLIVSLEKTEADNEAKREERKNCEESEAEDVEEVVAKKCRRGNFCNDIRDSGQFFKELFKDLGLAKREKPQTPPEEVKVEEVQNPNNDDNQN